MYLPKHWVSETSTGRLPDGRETPLTAWGWGDDERSARDKAGERLQRLKQRLQRGDGFPEKYAYSDRPLKEEILETFAGRGAATGIVTRNAQGAQVLNTAKLLFLDIDLQPVSGWQRLLARLGLSTDHSEGAVLARLKVTLQQYGKASFRIYRTAAGLRVLAVDREFDPAGREAQELMTATGTDPAFTQLCKVQKSFRARLTPKPWRCGVTKPPGRFPRNTDTQRLFEEWRRDYQNACDRYATCQILETIGSGRPTGSFAKLVELHDRQTRCTSHLPLA
ncbi:MAG: hypothetical protein KJO54_07140 [Gammaproteobacteria bacterium]|nr:hypothetical protein [Gammaproteobacteria bacterium]NNF62402.1 hypothetical protein [Gammaproteobacteria bacterium]NNM20908.1 hypothetical protein [Gammaproteobacteria bacterium]